MGATGTGTYVAYAPLRGLAATIAWKEPLVGSCPAWSPASISPAVVDVIDLSSNSETITYKGSGSTNGGQTIGMLIIPDSISVTIRYKIVSTSPTAAATIAACPIAGSIVTLTGLPAIDYAGIADVFAGTDVWLMENPTDLSGDPTEGYGATLTLKRFHSFGDTALSPRTLV